MGVDVQDGSIGQQQGHSGRCFHVRGGYHRCRPRLPACLPACLPPLLLSCPNRLAVLFVFPTFMGAIKALRSVILFRRGSVADKEVGARWWHGGGLWLPSRSGRQSGATCSRCRCSSHPLAVLPARHLPTLTQKFNNWIDEQRAASPQPGLSVYPEGHRSTLGESLPLKRGMLHYAYSRKLPVQVVIGANKEAIISEKHCTARLNQTAVVGYSGGWLRGWLVGGPGGDAVGRQCLAAGRQASDRLGPHSGRGAARVVCSGQLP